MIRSTAVVGGLALVLALPGSMGCRSTTGAGPADARSADAPADAAATVDVRDVASAADGDVAAGLDQSVQVDTAADLPRDLLPAADAAGGVPCGSTTCNAGELCVINTLAGGVPGSGVSISYTCRPRPGSCPAEPDCNCTRSLCLAPAACSCRIPTQTSQTVQCDCAAP